MIKFETEFECKTEQEVIYALQHIIDRIECGYRCGYLTESSAEGDWGMSGEEEDYRLVSVDWDVSDSEFETFVDEGVPRKVYVPMSVEEEDIADWLSDEYGYCVESYTIESEE
ncbi:MAG: hypothetical protein J6Q39_10920 [Bacteroidales bacterium]|nr:hypothetical protein [Bacteroidales bacterium]